MNTNTAMRIATLPAAREIHPLGHTPSAGPQNPAECHPRPRLSWDRTQLREQDAADDVFVLGMRVRNETRFRRRRAVAAALVTALVLLVWSLSSVLAHHLVPAAAGDPVPTSAAAVHVVQPGDTLWSIAAEVVGAPEDRIREVVDSLADRAGGAELSVGQRVRVDGLDVGR